MSKHTQGPWVVIERRHPYKDGNKAHIERNIYTEREHPQLKGRYPIVCTSIGVGLTGKPAINFVSINEADARLIAAAPDLLAVVKELQESVAYWSEYYVPLGIVDRINAAIEKAEGTQK